ncbi:unnamed protein product, partial [Oppiella nova]
MPKTATLVLLVSLMGMAFAIRCTFDAECTVSGVVHQCVNGQCQLAPGPVVECYQDVNCYAYGIYFKCENAKCVPSDHKICLSDADCKKNKLHKHCKENHCKFPDRILYASTVKARSHITYAAQVGVKQMTFDKEHELHKVKQLHPCADMVLRIRVPRTYSKWHLGTANYSKYGASLQQVRPLLQVAKKLGVNVIGTSFYVGTLCQQGDAYAKAIGDAKYAFDQGKELGFNMHLLDIGGGFSGSISALNETSDQMAQTVYKALELYFPANTTTNLTIISEFGRYYVDTGYTLAAIIEDRKRVELSHHKSNIRTDMPYYIYIYYITDGAQCGFRRSRYQRRLSDPSTIWGPAYGSNHTARKGVMLPELSIGEWVYFRNMGAYTLYNIGAEFMAFKVPRQFFYVTDRARHFIDNMFNRDRIFAILETGLIPSIPVIKGPGANSTIPATVGTVTKSTIQAPVGNGIKSTVPDILGAIP